MSCVTCAHFISTTVCCHTDNLHVKVVNILLDIKIPAVRMQVSGLVC